MPNDNIVQLFQAGQTEAANGELDELEQHEGFVRINLALRTIDSEPISLKTTNDKGLEFALKLDEWIKENYTYTDANGNKGMTFQTLMFIAFALDNMAKHYNEQVEKKTMFLHRMGMAIEQGQEEQFYDQEGIEIEP